MLVSASIVLFTVLSPSLCAFAAHRSDSSTQSQKADSILILKKDHVMELIAGGKVIRTYKVALGQGGLAPKQREGDARTRKATTPSMPGSSIAPTTEPCTSPIQAPETANAPRAFTSHPVEPS